MTTIRIEAGPARARGLSSRLLGDRRFPVLVTLLLLIVMYAFGSYRYSFDAQVPPNLLINNSYLIVAAVGATFVILSGGIDLSIGSLVGFSAVLLAVLVTKHHWPLWAAVPVVLVVGGVGGALMGSMVHFFKVQPFIATLTGLFLFRGLSQMLAKGSIPINEHSVNSLAQYQIPLPAGAFLSVGAALAIVVVAVAAVVLHYTRFGRRIYSIGGNEQSALLMGIPVGRTKIATYAVSGFCSALAGLVYVLYQQSGDPLAAIGMELDAIAAVVIGGTLLTGGAGYVLGSLLGVLLMGLIKTIITDEGVSNSWWTEIITGALVLTFILLQLAVTARRKRTA